jgi:hypothetical protein
VAGLVFLGWLLSFAGHQQAFFGLDGWFDAEAYREAGRMQERYLRAVESGDLAEVQANQPVPVPIGWSILYLVGSDPLWLNLFYFGSLAVLLLFTLGLWTRVTAVLTWVIVVSFLANPAISYDADFLLPILALYLMVGYLLYGLWSRNLSRLERLLGPADASVFARWLSRSRDEAEDKAQTGSYAANLTLRLLQIHFAIIVVISGLHKLQMGDWWRGVALWMPLHPPFETTAKDLRDMAPSANTTLFFLSLAQYLALAWQFAFPTFAWRKRWRPLLLGGALVGWAGSAFIFRLPWFGPIYLVGCLSYLTAAEWHTLAALPGRAAYGLRGLIGQASVPAGPHSKTKVAPKS